jgi:RHS repeat-associated protein
MTNPLVATPKSSTTAVSGIPLLESATDLRTAIESGDWASVAMGVVGTALDALTTVLDPFGAILAAGVGWLLEHVGPLKEALDALAGDADQVRAHAETWQNVAKELGAIGGDLATIVNGDTAGWAGTAGDSYRERGADTANLIAAAQEAAAGAASGVQIGGEVVAAVRQFVRDMIAEAVGHLVGWALQVVFTLGIGLTWVVPQVVNEVAKIANRISGVVTRLIKAMKALIPLLKRAGDLFGDTSKALRKLEVDPSSTTASGARAVRHTDTPPPARHDTPPPTHDAPSTDGPSGGFTTPSSSKEPPRAKGFNDNPDAHGTPVKDKSLCGDPIDVATGWMVMPRDDIELAGALPLIFSRTHLSSYRLGRWFGESWASTVDQRLEVEPDGLHLVLADGTILVYPIPLGGQEVLPANGPRLPLRRVGDGYEVVNPAEDQVLLFDTHLRSIMDGDGNRIDLRRAADGTPTAIEHSGGYRLDLHTDDGRITAITLRGKELIRYRYEKGRLVEVTDAKETTRFTYDADGRIVRWEDQTGRWYRYHYDHAGRCVRTEGADGYLDSELAYDQGVTTVTNSLGHATRYHLDDRLRLTAETDPLGNTTRYERDEHGRILARTDPLGRTTRYERDAAGNITTVTRPDGTRARREYDGRNQPVITTGPDGSMWAREYNARGKLVRTMDPTGAVTTYTYDAAGNVNTVTDPLGGVTRIESNPAGLPVTITDPVGAVTRYTYDDLGHQRTVTDPLGGTTTMTWDVTGELRERIDPDGAVWRWHEHRTIDPRGATTAAEYAHFDLLVAETGPDGGRLSYAYDTELRLVSVTNEQGLDWRYTYDPAGNMVSETDYNGRTTHYGYDAAGQLVLRGNGAGETVAFDRDELGRIIRRRAAGGVAEYTYDAAGRLTSARNTDAEVVFTYDELGRVVAESINGRTVRSTYDLAGRRTTRRTPSGAESRFTYDAADRPVELRTAGRTVRFEHDLAGRELARSLSGVELRQSWDAGDRLVTQTVRAGTRTVRHREYGYLPDGHLSRVDDTEFGPRMLDVDLAGRVLAVRGRAWQETYTYSPAGTIQHASWPGAAGPRHYLGTLLMSAGDTVYAHDPEGRTVARGRWRFEWNDDSRLTGVTTPDGQRWRYRYDALGRRICKQRMDGAGRIAEQTQFTWDGANLAEEVRDGGTHAQPVATVWEWEPGTARVVTQTRRVLGKGDLEFHAVVTDLVGAPSELVDEQGNVAWQARMTLWGKLLSARGTAYTPLRFPGQYHDAETGLYYNVNRYYDPDTGRYLSHDPFGLDPSPDSMAYVGNPTAWIDPLGLTACTLAGGSGGGKKPPGQNNAQAGPGPSTMANKKRKRDDDDDDDSGSNKKQRESYEEGEHGAKKREQKRLGDMFDTKVSGATHQSEHTIGYEALGRGSGDGRGAGKQQKFVENHAWAYQEDKPSHRAHHGTGMHSGPSPSGFKSSQDYRDAQRNALEAGDPNTAIQLNQLDYAFRPEFRATNDTLSGEIADESFRHMIVNAHARGEGIQYATGPGTNGVTPPLTDRDAAELLLNRPTIRGQQMPTLAQEQDVIDQVEGRGPASGNRDPGGPWEHGGGPPPPDNGASGSGSSGVDKGKRRA